jgi:AmmeMemoRadiSam system protein B
MIDGFWETPLGNIEIDSRVGEILADEYDFVVETASSFEPDNTIELQLPFIKHFFTGARLLPIGAPPTMKSLDIARRAGELCRRMDIQAIAIGSTDLTHYGPNYGFVPAGTGKEVVKWVVNNDKRVIERICAMDAAGVMEEASGHQNACCAGACASAIVIARELGAHTAEALMYATSYDKSPGSSFVGYVGAVF